MGDGEIIQWLGCFGTPVFLVFGAEGRNRLGAEHEIPKIVRYRKYFF